MKQDLALICLTRFDETNELVQEALESLSALDGSGFTACVFDQKPDSKLEQVVISLSTDKLPMVYRTIPARSLSYARNCAIQAAVDMDVDIVLYIDADALVDPSWAKSLCSAFQEDTKCALVGARILAHWRVTPPLLSKARFVRDQFSLLDLGTERRAYHRVVGAGFGLHRGRLGSDARFDETLGRREGRLFSGEETELCARASAAGWNVLYEGKALVHHQIMAERASTLWIMKRFFYAGWSRARVGGAPSPSTRPAGAEWLAAAFLALPYFYGYLMGRKGDRRSRANDPKSV